MIKKHFITDKRFLLSVLAIALPVALQNMISFGVNMMDSLMLGRLGDTAISAANLGGKPFFLLMIIGFGLSSGGSVLIAQYWGKGDMKKIHSLFTISMQFMLVISAVFSVGCFFFPQQIMRVFTPDPVMIEASVQYLQTLAISFVFYSFSNCYMMSLRAVEKVKLSTYIYGISFFINVFFNYCFIFGKFGFDAYGIKGAAMGTIVARISEFLMVILYMYFRERLVNFRLKDLFKWNKSLLSDYIKHSLPVVGNELFWGLGSLAVSVVIGHISESFVAANSIADVVNQLMTVAIFGLANAAAVLTGKTIGEGRKSDAQKTANTFLVLTLGMACISCGLLLLLRTPILSLYEISPATHSISWSIMTVLALLQIPLALDLITIVGVLRGGGDTKYAFLIDCGCLWLVAVPLGIVGGIYFGLPAGITYFMLRADTILKCVLGVKRTMSGKWIRNITR